MEHDSITEWLGRLNHGEAEAAQKLWERYAENLVSPRWIYMFPNGDILVAEASTKASRGSSKYITFTIRR